MFEQLVQNAQVFFLVFARIAALLMVSPVFSSSSIPLIARGALAFFTALAVTPLVAGISYVIPEAGLSYVFLIVGEILLGIIMGLFLQMIFAVFQTAGQMFSVQMGFGASQAFDPLSQLQLPLLGQFLNLMGLFLFISVGGMQKIFLIGVSRSFESITAADLLLNGNYLQKEMIFSLAGVFEQALVIGFPMIATLMLVSVTMGLLAKAAPTMNLLMVGFPIQISVGFLVMIMAMPFIIERMDKVINIGFDAILKMLNHLFQGGVL